MKVFHFHIRKTAGTALRTIIKPVFSDAEICPYRSDLEFFGKVPADRREAELLKYPFISGHLYRTGAIVPDDYATITLLRNPYHRVISAFNHIQADQTDPLHTHCLGATLDDALDSEALASELWNGQTRAMVSAQGLDYDTISDRERIDAALAFLARCAIVGFQENMVSTSAKVCDLMGRPHHVPKPVNDKITANGISKPEGAVFTRKIAARNSIDLWVYNAAVEMYWT